MKKFILLCFVLVLPGIIFAQTSDCPFGFVDDEAPGTCARFIDTDSNNLCDLSEVPLIDNTGNIDPDNVGYISEEELKAKTVGETAGLYKIDQNEYAASLAKYIGKGVLTTDSLQVLHDRDGLCAGVAAEIALTLYDSNKQPPAVDLSELISGQEIKDKKVLEAAQIYNISGEEYANALAEYLGTNVKLTDSIGLLHDNYGLEPSIAKDIAANIYNNAENLSEIKNDNNKNIIPPYRFISLLATVLILYLFTYLLFKLKKITIVTLRKVWNILLFFSFLASVLLGLLLIIRINYGWYIGLPFNILYWHVEFGITMAIVGIIHIIWHWRYFLRLIKK